MKRTLVSLFAVAALAVSYVTVSAAQEKRVFSLEEAPVGQIDPNIGSDFADLILISNLYDTLVWPQGGGKGLGPHLAESWEITDDGTVYTFTLRKGVKFHDGSEVTAEDVVFSADRTVAIGQGYSFLFQGWIESAEAIDSHTVKITLTQQYAPFLAALVRLPIINKDLVMANLAEGDLGDMGDYGVAYLQENDAGSGAYTIVEHNNQELTVMARFDDYFLPFGPKSPDEVRMRYGLDDTTLRALMVRGEHDISSMWHPYEVYADLDTLDGISAVAEPQAGAFYIKINIQRPPMDNIHMRRAVALAFDYEAMEQVIQVKEGLIAGTRAAGPIPRGLLGHDASLPLPRQDLEAAKKELALSGYDPDTSPVVEILSQLCCNFHQRMALLTADALNKLGVKIEIKGMPWPMVVEMSSTIETTPHFTYLYQNSASPDIDPLMYELYHSSAGGQWGGMEWLLNDEVDTLLETARSELDTATREGLYKQVALKLIDLQPDIFIFDTVAIYAKRDAVTLPFENPDLLTGFIWADYNFRLTEVN